MTIDTRNETETHTTETFPWAAVEGNLRSSLVDLIRSNAAMNGLTLPTGLSDQYAAAAQIDSLDVVDLLCGVEPIVGFKLQDSIVKAGGYSSVNDAIDHVMPRIQAVWTKNTNKGKKR
jgi:hypothetical protein